MSTAKEEVPLLQPSPPLTSHAKAQRDRVNRWIHLGGAAIILSVGFGFGLTLPTDPALPGQYARVSAVVGWLYFACWSLSFYPQLLENWRRKSVRGLSFDFEVYNLIGFGCLSIFYAAFYYIPSVQEAYKQTHGGHRNAVEANDVFFAFHAFIITLVTLVQCVIYESGSQRVSDICKVVSATTILGGVVYGMLIAFQQNLCTCFTILSWLYLLSYVKLAISIFKYIPQVYLNYKRQSTVGWSIWNVLLDIGGGLLSLTQLLSDAYVKNDWTRVTGDPVKFGLGFVSLFFDAIFMVQHYTLYVEASPSEGYEKLEAAEDGKVSRT